MHACMYDCSKNCCSCLGGVPSGEVDLKQRHIICVCMGKKQNSCPSCFQAARVRWWSLTILQARTRYQDDYKNTAERSYIRSYLLSLCILTALLFVRTSWFWSTSKHHTWSSIIRCYYLWYCLFRLPSRYKISMNQLTYFGISPYWAHRGHRKAIQEKNCHCTVLQRVKHFDSPLLIIRAVRDPYIEH